MKVLVVDDEVSTREGIVSNMPWKDICVNEVLQADNGINALKLLDSFHPDIILTDVRMPRMNGIEFAYKIREIRPACQIILMSGYLDIQYLKSAIKLKVVNYIEKPIDLDELTQSLKYAVEVCSEERRIRESQDHINRAISESIPLLRSEIATELISTKINASDITQKALIAGLMLPPNAEYVTIVIQIAYKTYPIPPDTAVSFRKYFPNQVESLFREHGYECISAFKDEKHLVVHLYSSDFSASLLTDSHLKNACAHLWKQLQSHTNLFFTVGLKVQGTAKIFESYVYAVSVLPKAFYRGYGSVVFHHESEQLPYSFDSGLLNHFMECIEKGQKVQAEAIIHELCEILFQHDSTPIDATKDYFYKLLLHLTGTNILNKFLEDQPLWESLHSFQTLREIVNLSLKMLDLYFLQLDEQHTTSKIIREISLYICNNYMDENLSLQKISRHVYLTPAYICYLFKEEKGKTVHQYVTEYRVNKAKELLAETRLTVLDVAVKVGYGNGNYFAKVFRKLTSCTPSQYRENTNL